MNMQRIAPLLSGIVLTIHAFVATGRAWNAAEPCRMILVVESGVILAFDCQDEADCPDTFPVCFKVVEGTVEEPIYHCRCCRDESQESCAGGSAQDGYCTAHVAVPQSGNPVLSCQNTGHCGLLTCPQNPTPTTGAVACACE